MFELAFKAIFWRYVIPAIVIAAGLSAATVWYAFTFID